MSHHYRCVHNVCVALIVCFLSFSTGYGQLVKQGTSQATGVGRLIPSKGGPVLIPKPAGIAEYYGLLSAEDTQYLHDALANGRVAVAPIIAFDRALGQNGVFHEITGAGAQDATLTNLLQKPFIIATKTGVYMSRKALEYVNGNYHDTDLATLLDSLSTGTGFHVTPDNHYIGLYWRISTNGTSVLVGNNSFLPELGKYNVNGYVDSLIRSRTDDGSYRKAEGLNRAVIQGWCYQKERETNSIVGYVFKVTNGQLTVPVNRALLRIILEGGQGEPHEDTGLTCDSSYPVEGVMAARVVSLTNEGAVLDLTQGGGLYIAYGDCDPENPTMISFADDVAYTQLTVDETMRMQARILLEGTLGTKVETKIEGEADSMLIPAVGGLCVLVACVAVYLAKRAVAKRSQES